MRKSSITLCLILFSLTVIAQSKGDELYQQAKSLLKNGEQASAIKNFIKAQESYLKDKNYYRYFVATQALSIIYQDNGEGTLAEKIIHEAEKNIPQTSKDDFELHAKLKDNLAYTYLYVQNRPDDAVDAYNDCIALYEKAGKAGTVDFAFELVNRSITLHSISRFIEAAKDMEQAISIYKGHDETTAQDLAGYYLQLGLSYTELRDFANGSVKLNEGLKLLQSPDDDQSIAKFYNALGNLSNANGDYVMAIDYYNQAKKINESLAGKESPLYLENVMNEATALHDMGDWHAALVNYQDVLAIYQQAPPGDLNVLIDLFLNIARLTDDLGMGEQSEAIHQQALKLASEHIGRNSVAEANVYEGMAATAFNHGAFDRSLDYNFKALSIFNNENALSKIDQALILHNVGQAYDELNDLELSIKYKQQAIELYTQLYGSRHASTGMAIGNLAHTYELMNNYDEALSQLRRSLSILSETLAPGHDHIGITYLDMGLMYMKKNDLKFSIEYLGKAKAVFDGYSKNMNKVKVYNRLAMAHYIKRDFAKAEAFAHGAIVANTYNFDGPDFDAIPVNPDFLNYYELISSYIMKSQLYGSRGGKENLMKGLKHLQAADEILKMKAVSLSSNRDRLELAELNSFFTEAGLILSNELFLLTQDQQYVEKAFYFSERSKANELLSEIKLNRATTMAKLPKKLIARSNDIDNRLNSIRQQIAAAQMSKSQALITKLKVDEFELLHSHNEIQRQISEVVPALKSVGDPRSIPGWQDVRKNIPERTILVSYSITDSAKFIFIGNTTKLVMKQIPSKTDLDRWMRGYMNVIKTQSTSFTDVTKKLTELLWQPVEEAISGLGPVEHVIIIPDGPLHLLPFESLGNEKFLIEQYTISYRPSAALLGDKTVSIKKKPSFIAMAPVFEDKETNFVNKSCQRFVEFAQKVDTTTRAFTLNGEYVSPLPATKVEVEKIHAIHISKGNVTKYFLKEDAKEELIKAGELGRYDYIHLATHGFVNSQYPDLSGLLLTQDKSSSEDGVLYSGEILGLELKADLVTLSACETALGKKIEGEGVRGLTTAFLFAGSRTVVASLWKVADESTSLLMIEFYNQLLSGKDKATALKNAKLSLIKDANHRHPYFWAPFVHIGAN